MADFPSNPSKSPDMIQNYPLDPFGYARPATPEEIDRETDLGYTYPDLHRRIAVSQGLNTFTITIYGKPILKDKFENDLTIPDPDMSEAIVKTLITNAYDVKIVDVGEYVKDYIDDYIVDGYEVNFVWIVRSEDDVPQYADGYTLMDIINEVYRGSYKVLQPDTLDYHVSAKVERDQLLEKDTYQIYVSATGSFRTTQHYTYDPDMDQEVP